MNIVQFKMLHLFVHLVASNKLVLLSKNNAFQDLFGHTMKSTPLKEECKSSFSCINWVVIFKTTASTLSLKNNCYITKYIKDITVCHLPTWQSVFGKTYMCSSHHRGYKFSQYRLT